MQFRGPLQMRIDILAVRGLQAQTSAQRQES